MIEKKRYEHVSENSTFTGMNFLNNIDPDVPEIMRDMLLIYRGFAIDSARELFDKEPGKEWSKEFYNYLSYSNGFNMLVESSSPNFKPINSFNQILADLYGLRDFLFNDGVKKKLHESFKDISKNMAKKLCSIFNESYDEGTPIKERILNEILYSIMMMIYFRWSSYIDSDRSSSKVEMYYSYLLKSNISFDFRDDDDDDKNYISIYFSDISFYEYKHEYEAIYNMYTMICIDKNFDIKHYIINVTK